MSYDSKELSEQDSEPVLLYEFIQGETTFRYSGLDEYVTAGGHTWAPAVIEPGKFLASTDISKNNLQLQIPTENPLGSTFVGWTPDLVTVLTIYRGHRDDEILFYWKGHISSSNIAGCIVTLECESIFSAMRRTSLRILSQRNCRHVVYDEGCKLYEIGYRVSAVLLTLDGFNLTFRFADGVSSTSDFTNGMLTAPDGTTRAILAHDGFSLTLIRPIRSLFDALAASPSGVPITLLPGCDNTLQMCHAVFNNVGNYGGQAWMPSIDPIQEPLG